MTDAVPNPLISVIVPVYNGARYLAEAIESVIAQDYTPLEIIVASDGSTDESPMIARSFPDVTCLDLPHGGVSRARNVAVERSMGKWLAFLDADDRWLPGKLRAQVAAGESGIGDVSGFVLCCQVHRFEGEVPAWFLKPVDGRSETAFEPSAWLVRRDVFDVVGPFDEARALGEDTDWLSRASDAGVKYNALDGVFVERRIHDTNTSRILVNPNREMLKILRESLVRKRQNKMNDEA